MPGNDGRTCQTAAGRLSPGPMDLRHWRWLLSPCFAPLRVTDHDEKRPPQGGLKKKNSNAHSMHGKTFDQMGRNPSRRACTASASCSEETAAASAAAGLKFSSIVRHESSVFTKLPRQVQKFSKSDASPTGTRSTGTYAPVSGLRASTAAFECIRTMLPSRRILA